MVYDITVVCHLSVSALLVTIFVVIVEKIHDFHMKISRHLESAFNWALIAERFN